MSTSKMTKASLPSRSFANAERNCSSCEEGPSEDQSKRTCRCDGKLSFRKGRAKSQKHWMSSVDLWSDHA